MFVMKKIKQILIYLMISFFVWMGISNVIQAIKCPKMTQTQLLINIPNSFIGNWKDCR